SLHGESDERFQALLRLPLSDGRILTAGELVPAAEASGLIAEVDRWVLERCLDTMRQHQQEGRASRLFASQSLASVRHPGLLAWLQQALQARPVPPQHLCMELRGSDVLLALEEVTTFALAVRALGIRLAVSEVDATNAVALLALPIHFIKLSSHYTDIRDTALRDELRQLVDQAHERDLSVIAPRVEEAHAAALLWSTGVDLIQGNFVQQVARELSYDFTASST
ncbi:MAG: EAL domain-containing protein, partial [Dokdonella sp.]